MLTKKTQYTVVKNEIIRDEQLSLPAKGLITLLLSLPPRDIEIEELLPLCKESQEEIESILTELGNKGYLTINN